MGGIVSDQPSESRASVEGDPLETPQATARHHLGFSWIWLVPLGALALVGYLIYGLAAERGPTISISFKTADGLVAQQTQVRYKAVTLGTVDQIELGDDLSHVVVKVRMNAQAADFLGENTRFWVARPRLNGGLKALQTGLETLVSGAYVAMDPGPKSAAKKTHFEGLEKPPSVRSDQPGSVYFLDAESLGGISEGSPIFYRDVNVGEVLSYRLEETKVSLRVFVKSPYDHNVTKATHFWNSSGVRVDTGADGLRIELQSISSLLAGGIAFRNPPNAESTAPSPPETRFRLFPDKPQAELGFYALSIPYVTYFRSSVRGLTKGSEVHMFGKALGLVTSVDLVSHPTPGHAAEPAVRVAFVLQPERAARQGEQLSLAADGMQALVRDHLRVVLETTSLLTGQKALSLEYVPDAKPAEITQEDGAWVLPGEARDLQELPASLAQIASRINAIPFEQLGKNANETLVSLQRTIGSPELQRAIVSLDRALGEAGALAREARNGLGPALARLPRISEKLERAIDGANVAVGQAGYGSDSTIQRNLERMMSEVADAARSVRLLTDYLNRHPESVISGRSRGEP